MRWISINDLPTNEGKYVVKTRTMTGNIHKVECYFNGKNFNVTNQVVFEWLNEEEA